MKRFLVSLTLLSLVVAGQALAQVPRTMSYQGVLTNNAGVLLPDGNYNLTFRIYNVPVAGAALFIENHPVVPLTNGGFSVILGSISALNLPFDGPYYLGVQVGVDPEMAPRVPLAASPYALGLVLPFRSSTTAGTTLIEGYDHGGVGGAIRLHDTGFNLPFRFEPDIDGGGSGWLLVNGPQGGLNIDGNTGSTSTLSFGSTAGDASMVLPDNAVSSPEMLNEPGIAQEHVNFSVNIPDGASMTDLLLVTITTPAAGYIVVEADGQHGIGTNGVHQNWADLQIDETAGGGLDATHYFISGYQLVLPSGWAYHPVSLRRTYFKPAGAYTFRLEGDATNPGGLSNYLWDATITATYYPTSYGAVNVAPSLAEAGAFDKVQRTPAGTNGGRTVAGEGVLVDLRELELKAARAREAAARADAELARARSNQPTAR